MANIETKANCERTVQPWTVKLTLLALICLQCIPSAKASAVTYTLVGVTFTDGGTATGHLTVDYNNSSATLVDYLINVLDAQYPDQPLAFAPSNGTRVFLLQGTFGDAWGFYNGTPPGTQPPNANDDAATLGIPPSVLTGPPPTTTVPLGPIGAPWQKSTLEKVVNSRYVFFANGLEGSFAPTPEPSGARLLALGLTAIWFLLPKTQKTRAAQPRSATRVPWSKWKTTLPW